MNSAKYAFFAFGLCFFPISAWALSITDPEALAKMEQIDRDTQRVLLQQARQAALEGAFPMAYMLLKRAQPLAHNPVEIEAVRTFIETRKNAKAENRSYVR